MRPECLIGWSGIRKIGGENGALLLVSAADDLKQQIGVAVIEGEKADFIEDEQTDFGVVLEPTIERSRGFLGAEVEQQLRGGNEERGVPCECRVMSDVLGDHGLAQALWGD